MLWSDVLSTVHCRCKICIQSCLSPSGLVMIDSWSLTHCCWPVGEDQAPGMRLLSNPNMMNMTLIKISSLIMSLMSSHRVSLLYIATPPENCRLAESQRLAPMKEKTMDIDNNNSPYSFTFFNLLKQRAPNNTNLYQLTSDQNLISLHIAGLVSRQVKRITKFISCRRYCFDVTPNFHNWHKRIISAMSREKWYFNLTTVLKVLKISDLVYFYQQVSLYILWQHFIPQGFIINKTNWTKNQNNAFENK